MSATNNEVLTNALVIEKQENLIVKAGQTQNVAVKLTNKGSINVNQATLKLSLDQKVEGIEIKVDTTSIKNLKAKEVKQGNFSIKVGEEVKAGIYKGSILVNELVSYPISIQVDSHIVPSALEVSMVGQAVFVPGQEQEVTLKLENVGDRDARNVRLEVLNTEHISIVEGSNVKHIAVAKKKGIETVKLKLKVVGGVTVSSVPVSIKLTYLGSDGEQKEETQSIY